MLTLVNGMNRREFLRVGGLSLGGLTLSNLLANQTAAGPLKTATGKSVIFLFMHGGPPQQETFDPKMTAPLGVRSAMGEIATSLPGVTYGSGLPRLAKLAHKTSIVRSYEPGNANHDIKPIVGKDSATANLGSLYARAVGANHPTTGMPRNIALFPQAVEPSSLPAVTQFGRFDSSGMLGAAYAPFVPGGTGNFERDLKMSIPRGRFDDRRALLSQLDTLRRNLDQSAAWESMGQFQQQAFQTILGGLAGAFDLSKEDPRTVERYDTRPLLNPDQIDKKWNNHKNYADHGATLGRLLLLARRLCESGCGFVTVTTSFVWDFHADANNATVTEGMRYVGNPFDHAVSAFVEDLEARGLSDKILLVCCGEIGRTPKINAKGGRDHWGGLGPLLLAGGGLKMGRVIGQSNADASAPDSDLVTAPNLIGTIMHTLLDMPELRLVPGLPSDVQRIMSTYEPIPGLI